MIPTDDSRRLIVSAGAAVGVDDGDLKPICSRLDRRNIFNASRTSVATLPKQNRLTNTTREVDDVPSRQLVSFELRRKLRIDLHAADVAEAEQVKASPLTPQRLGVRERKGRRQPAAGREQVEMSATARRMHSRQHETLHGNLVPTLGSLNMADVRELRLLQAVTRLHRDVHALVKTRARGTAQEEDSRQNEERKSQSFSLTWMLTVHPASVGAVIQIIAARDSRTPPPRLAASGSP